MKIYVLAKQVPDPEKFPVGRYRSDGRLDREAFPMSVSPIDKNATELALTLAGDAPVRVFSMGPQSAVSAIRDLLSMGVSEATHICDPQLSGADLLTTAKVLAAAIKKHGDFDLVICGKQTTDAMNASIPAMVAEILGVPSLLAAESVEMESGELFAKTISDAGLTRWKLQLPAVVSVTKNINIPRLPSLRGMTKAMSIPIETISLESLGVDLESGKLTMISQEPVTRQIETVMIDGETPEMKAEKLIASLKEKGAMP